MFAYNFLIKKNIHNARANTNKYSTHTEPDLKGKNLLFRNLNNKLN